MSKNFSLENTSLILHSRCPIEEINGLVKFLQEKRYIIKVVSFECEQNFATIYLLKKILGSKIKLDGATDKQLELFQYLNTEKPKDQNQIPENQFNPVVSVSSLLTGISNNKSQDKFWIKNFLMAQKVLLLNGIAANFIWFFTAGFTLSLTAYKQLLVYSLENESYMLVYIVMIRSICPLISAFLMTAKSCTAIAASTKSMQLSGETKVLMLINLPLYPTYLHPIFVACIIVAPILNMLAIIASIMGSMCCYIFVNGSIGMFVGIYENIFTIPDLLDSMKKAFFCGIWSGIVTCSSSQYPGSSFQSIIGSVDSCVTCSIIGFIIIQFIIEMLTKF